MANASRRCLTRPSAISPTFNAVVLKCTLLIVRAAALWLHFVEVERPSSGSTPKAESRDLPSSAVGLQAARDYCGPRTGPMLDFSKNSRIVLYAFSICSSVKSP